MSTTTAASVTSHGSSRRHATTTQWFMTTTLAIWTLTITTTQAWSFLNPTATNHNKISTTAVRVGTTFLQMTFDETAAPPTTFREAEVLGLRFMQEGNYEQALQGAIYVIVSKRALKLPGSRPDVIRTKVYAKSPVGGGMGGTESKFVLNLDEFELQAVHYNMACAHAQLKNPTQALSHLESALKNGFDSYSTVRTDADLQPLWAMPELELLLQRYEPKGLFGGAFKNNNKQNNVNSSSSNAKTDGGFNPFGLFGSK